LIRRFVWICLAAYRASVREATTGLAAVMFEVLRHYKPISACTGKSPQTSSGI
jgi:hypothetical protein